MPRVAKIPIHAICCFSVALILLCATCAWPYVSALGQEGGIAIANQDDAAADGSQREAGSDEVEPLSEAGSEGVDPAGEADAEGANADPEMANPASKADAEGAGSASGFDAGESGSGLEEDADNGGSTDNAKDAETDEATEGSGDKAGNEAIEESESAQDDADQIATYATVSSTGMKAKYTTEYDGATNMPASDANSWQVVRESYSSVKAGEGTYSYASDDAVRVQKAVIANGQENDFQVYLNVEPQLSWEEFFKSLDNYATHNNSSTFNPNSGCTRLLSQDEYDALPADEKTRYSKITVTYKLTNNSYDVTRYANFSGSGKDSIQNVKNGSYAWSSEKFNKNGLINSVDWPSIKRAAQSGSGATLVVDARPLESQFTFSDKPVYPKSVTDPMGENIQFKGVNSADAGSIDAPAIDSFGGTLNWILPTAMPPDPPYYSFHTETGKISGTNTDGTVTILENLVTVNRGGKQTAYYTGVLEMRYAVGLNTSADGFNSCGDPTSTPSAKATYDTNGTTTLSYQVNSAKKSTNFAIPAVKGLLYDFELRKIDEKTRDGLAGAVFQLLDENGDPVNDAAGNPITATSESDGTVKFHNLPWGTYTAKEIQAPPGYLMTGSPNVGPYKLCWTTNKAQLTLDHAGSHQADWVTDKLNMLPRATMQQVTNKRTIGLVVLKQDAETHARLVGVGFALHVDNGDGVFTDADKLAHVWSDFSMTTLCSEGVTDDTGTISFYGLEPGTYWLCETRALAGYRLLDKPVKITVTNDSKVYFHESMVEGNLDSSNVAKITVDNDKIPKLPSSGSSGGLLLGVAGLVLITVGVVAGVSARAVRGKHQAHK